MSESRVSPLRSSTASATTGFAVSNLGEDGSKCRITYLSASLIAPLPPASAAFALASQFARLSSWRQPPSLLPLLRSHGRCLEDVGYGEPLGCDGEEPFCLHSSGKCEFERRNRIATSAETAAMIKAN